MALILNIIFILTFGLGNSSKIDTAAVGTPYFLFVRNHKADDFLLA